MVRITHEIHTEHLENHLVLYGWMPHYVGFLQEIHSEGVRDSRTVLIVHLDPSRPLENLGEQVYFFHSLGSYEADLVAANVQKAHTLVISSHFFQKDGAQANSQAILIALLAKKLHPELRIVADVPFGNHTQALLNAGIDEVVCAEEYCSMITANTILNEGISPFFREVLSTQYGSEFYLVPFGPTLYGKPFLQALETVKEHQNALILAVVRGRNVIVNPQFLTIEKNDWAIVLTEQKLDKLE